MKFSDMMSLLFYVDEKVPGMSWKTEDGRLVLTLPIGAENVKLLEDASKMFAPL